MIRHTETDIVATLYDRVGGEPFFAALVERFYAGVENDPVLRPLYPARLERSKRHLALFLAQYFGGPPVYHAERGHPRLRMRHVRFAIGRAERDAWLAHMHAAVAAAEVAEEDRATLLSYFDMAATSLVNRFPGGPERTPNQELGFHLAG
jgi:hemoglobin